MPVLAPDQLATSLAASAGAALPNAVTRAPNAAQAAVAGANVFVAGSAIFSHPDGPQSAISELRETASVAQ